MTELGQLLDTAAPRPRRRPPDEAQLARRARRTSRRRRTAAAAVGVAALAGAIGIVSTLRSSSSDDDGTATQAGQMVVWVQQPAETDEGFAATIAGVVYYDDAAGCFLVDTSTGRFPVVWPAGTRPLDAELGVALADGTPVRPGQTISGAGAYEQADELADQFDIPDSCLPATGEVAVFNPNDAIAVDPGG